MDFISIGSKQPTTGSTILNGDAAVSIANTTQFITDIAECALRKINELPKTNRFEDRNKLEG